MWFCFNDAFVSVVAHRKRPSILMVRARSYQHLRNLFGSDVKITVTPDNDYRFRVFTTREKWAVLVSQRIENIDYSNFKDSVKEKKLKSLYSEFWYLHMLYQEGKNWMKKFVHGDSRVVL